MLGGHELGEVDGVQRPIGGQVRPGAIQQRIGAGQLDHVGRDGIESDRVQLGGRLVVEPARVVLPDGPHVPGDLPIALAHFVFRGQRDLAHQGADILSGIHSGDRLIVHVLDGVAQPGQLGVDALGPATGAK